MNSAIETRGGISTNEITHALFASLARREHIPSVITEFAHNSGRVDVLAIDDDLVAGYEVKSDNDSLCRVSSQVASFSRFCDTLTFVAGPRLAVRLLAELPNWCGVQLAYRREGEVALAALRYAAVNPRFDIETALHIFSLQDLRGLAGKGFRDLRKKAALVGHLSARYPSEVIRLQLRTRLKLRAKSLLAAQQA